MNTLSTSVTIGGIQNPTSMSVSDTFKLRTYSSLPSLLNYISSGVTVQMTTPYVLNTFTITPLSSIVNTNTKQTVNIVHVIPLQINDFLLVNVDASMTIAASVSCTAVSGVTGISCVRINSTQVKVTYTTSPLSQTLQYDISTWSNYDIAQTSITLTATVYTSTSFVK